MFRALNFTSILLKIFLTVFSILITAILLYPIAYVVLTSLLVGEKLAVNFNDIINSGITLERYVKIISDTEFLKGLIMSLIVSALNILFSVLVITPAAYAFSRFKFRGKSSILLIYLILGQIGGGFGVAAIISLYVLLLKMNSIGIPVIGNPVMLALIYTAGAVPSQTWLIKNYFDTLPRELDDAAFIDGASWWDIVFKIALPASKPAMAIIALFAFMGAWGEFIIASFVKIPTLAAYIYQTAGAQTMFWGDFAARTLLFAIPVAILYIISQRRIGEAIRFGAGKI